MRSKSKPSVDISSSSDFNTLETLVLKDMCGKYIMWLMCSFTKCVKGVALKDKMTKTVMKTLYNSSCIDLLHTCTILYSKYTLVYIMLLMEKYLPGQADHIVCEDLYLKQD